jgi:hypothetical protein
MSARTHTPRTRIVARALAVAVLAATPAAAFNPQPEPPAFGMIGLSRMQKVLLHAVLTRPVGTTRAGCEVVLSFVDGTGKPFHDAAGAEITRVATLRDQTAASLSLDSRDVLTDGAARKAIRAVLSQPPDPTETDCGGLVATLEIVNARGRTVLFYPGPAIADPVGADQ